MHESLGGCTRIGIKTPWTLIFMRNLRDTHNIAEHCEAIDIILFHIIDQLIPHEN